jgi:hypothetical protein
MTLHELEDAAARLGELLSHIANNPTDEGAVMELQTAIGPGSWLWEVPDGFGPALAHELQGARWWANDLARYDAHDPGEGMVGALLSLQQRVQGVLNEVKKLPAPVPDQD